MKTPECIVRDFQDKDLVLDNQDRFKEEVSIAIYQLMDDSGLRYKDLADRLGCSKAYVSKILTGNHNFTSETIADIFMALGRAVHLHLDSRVSGATEATDSLRQTEMYDGSSTTSFYNNKFAMGFQARLSFGDSAEAYSKDEPVYGKLENAAHFKADKNGAA